MSAYASLKIAELMRLERCREDELRRLDKAHKDFSIGLRHSYQIEIDDLRAQLAVANGRADCLLADTGVLKSNNALLSGEIGRLKAELEKAEKQSKLWESDARNFKSCWDSACEDISKRNVEIDCLNERASEAESAEKLIGNLESELTRLKAELVDISKHLGPGHWVADRIDAFLARKK